VNTHGSLFLRGSQAGCDSVQKKSQVNERIAVARYMRSSVLYCVCERTHIRATTGEEV